MRRVVKLCVGLSLAVGTVMAWGAETRRPLRSHRPAPIAQSRPLPMEPALPRQASPAKRSLSEKEIRPGSETGRDRDLYMEA